MAGVSGVTFLIQVNTGTETSPTWTAVGGQRGATLNRSVDEADVTSKDSLGWHEGLPSESFDVTSASSTDLFNVAPL